MSPIAGFTRLRKHQFGRQADFGTKVSATRAYPFSGVPTVELNWTDPEIDVGSRDPVAPPYRTAPDLTASLTDPALAYNNIPILMCGFFGGDEAPANAGTSYTWTHEPASLTVDDPDTFTYEFGDDVLTDWFQLGDGILESVEITGPDGLGPLSTSMSWRFAPWRRPARRTARTRPSFPRAASRSARRTRSSTSRTARSHRRHRRPASPAGKISDALHNFTLRLSQEMDVKRFANGSQTFDADAYGPGARTIELECTFAKTADIVGTGSESDDWMSDDAVNRYVQLYFESTSMADGATPYSWTITMPMRYYTRTEGEIGGNTTVVLTGHAFYDAVEMSGVFESVAVTQLSEAMLGLAGS